MRNSANNWLTILIVMAVGILLIVYHQHLDLLNWLVIAVGVALVVPALYSVFTAISNRRHISQAAQENDHLRVATRSTLWASAGAVALGIWMIVNPGFFVGLIAYIFGAILVLYGIFHIVIIAMAAKTYRMPGWFYVIPVLMIIAGVVILCTSVRSMNAIVVLITGIALVASSVNSVMEYVGTSSTPRE